MKSKKPVAKKKPTQAEVGRKEIAESHARYDYE